MESRRSAIGRKALIAFARVAVAGVLLFALFQVIHPRDLVAAFERAKPAYVAFGLVTGFISLALRYLKWRLLVRSTFPGAGHPELFHSFLAGLTLGATTPGEIGELGGRALPFHSDWLAQIVGLSVLDRSQTFLTTVLFGLPAMGFVFIPSLPFQWPLALLCLLVVTAVYVKLHEVGSFLRRAAKRFMDRPWLVRTLDSFSLSHRETVGRSFLYNLGIQGVLLVQIYFFLNAFSPTPFANAAVGYSAVMLMKSVVPISLGDLGVRESSAVIVFRRLELPDVTALSASLLVFAVNVVLPAAVGAALVPMRRKKTVSNATR